jgi:hypothetical protein
MQGDLRVPRPRRSAARRFVIGGEVPDVKEFMRSGGLGDD